MKLIAHVDADSFYVSCERVRSPGLLNKAVCVLGNQGAVVVARSYEAKKTGVKVGTPVWEAKKLYPEMVFIKRDFQWYGVLSEAMQEVLSEFSDTIEYYSIDESFVDLGDFTGNEKKLAAEIQNVMKKKTGLPVSVGISLNKTLAKMASDKDKPLGTKVVLKDGLEDFLRESLASEVSGIGARLENRLALVGIKTAFDFVSKDRAFIKSILHRPGECLWYELNGHLILPVRNERPQRKSISRGGSLSGVKKDKNIIFAFLVRNMERLVDSIVAQKIEVKKLVLLIISSSGNVFKGEVLLSDYTSSFTLIFAEFKKIFLRIFNELYSYSGLHLIAEEIRGLYLKQLNLFDFETVKLKKISTIKEKINAKFGVFALRMADTAYINDVFADDANNFEVSDMDKKFCF